MFQNIGQVWRRASLTQRVLLLTVLVASGVAAVVLVGWARKPNMALLYSGLAPEEAARIVEKVRDARVPVELRDGGTTILVPDDQVYSLRLGMAAGGLPAGDQAGYRILDKEKIGSSPFSQQVNYTRALEGELARTVQGLDGVVSARVHVVRPEGVLFAGAQKQASATVVVHLKAGKRLTEGNVAAIVHLLAGSVESLSPDNVVVVDGQGNLLSSEAKSELARGAGTFLDYKSRVEQYLGGKAEEMLTLALGPGRATVRVDAVIETSRTNQTVESYDPEKRVVSKEEIKTKNSSAPAEGTPPAPRSGSTKEETTLSEYLVGRTVKQESGLPGKIESLSVAVLVDLSEPAKKEGEAPAAAAARLTKEGVLEIVQRATGATKDNITVTETAFYRPPPPEGAQGGQGLFSPTFLLEIAKRASLGILVIGALLALKVFGGARGKAAAQPALETQGAGGALLAQSAGPADAQVMRARITRALQDNPEEVKRLFLSWVESEKKGA